MADTKTPGAGLRQLQAYPSALQFVSQLSPVDLNKVATIAVQLKALMDAGAMSSIEASEEACSVFDDLHGVVDNLLVLPSPEAKSVRGSVSEIKTKPKQFFACSSEGDGLALQPGVLADVASSRRFRDSGLLARFLFAMPDSNVGTRDVRRRWAIPSYIQKEYELQIHGLLDGRQQQASKPRVLGMTDPAREAWLAFAAEIEEQLGERGALESIADWSSKLPGAAARIAALLEVAESGVAADSVSLEATEKAVQLCRLLIDHAHAAFGLLGADATDTDATAIVKWARDARLLSFSRRQCQKAMEGRFRSIERLEKALERLSQSDVARIDKVPNKGAPPTTMIRMNPKLFVEKG